MGTYSRFPLTLVKGQGSRVWDDQGKEYLDFVAGIAVCNLGHGHPAVTQVIAAQADALVHVSNLYYTGPMAILAQGLVENSFADKVFFGNSGAEANEGAIKLARKYSYDHFGPGRHEIICAQNSFHGRTLATLSATGQDKVKKGFDPLMPGFSFVPYNDLPALAEAVTDRTCAVLLEPVLGEGGVILPDRDYLKGAKSLCRTDKLLLIFDEVQVGMGRTGTLFAHQFDDVAPDIMTLAKALANGLPLGAVLATEDVAASFTPGAHASTFGGGPVVAAAAGVVLKTLIDGRVLDNCRQVGEYFINRLRSLGNKVNGVKDVRGRGLIIGMELEYDGTEVVKEMMQRGFLINCVQTNVLRFVPPLIVTEQEVDLLLAALEEVLKTK
ncbi:MAG: aspartate aminotransferase family protein [Deltaproteobacteria bacterium]|nr:aspartate aminotransferase family protein [Deltaproteobacteria bacterium]